MGLVFQDHGHTIFVCHQVDDFASGAATQEAAELFIAHLCKQIEAEFAGTIVETTNCVFSTSRF